VAERFVEEGETVAANEPLFRIVELDPITAVVHVTERDYAGLRDGQTATLRTDAYPARTFDGRIERIAPVFRETTRQARVELRIDNPDLRLKPGMFVRASVVLDEVADATVVPASALTTRDGREGLFVVAEDGATVDWRPVQAGIRDDQRVQVLDAADLAGRQVVTLGQQLLDDGSPVSVRTADSAVAGAVPVTETADAAQASR
jgi:RND family efflux transporter MFP subunit